MSTPAATQEVVVSTEVIQSMLDDNQSLIMAILENQNLGKLDQCAQLQQRLQANLLYLSALADAQPAPNAGTGAQAAPQ